MNHGRSVARRPGHAGVVKLARAAAKPLCSHLAGVEMVLGAENASAGIAVSWSWGLLEDGWNG
jgi:hypothetical protein